MKYLLILILALSMSGCFYQSVNKSDIDSATKICQNVQAEVVEIRASCFGDETVVCSNRKKYPIDSVILGEK